MRLVGLDLTVNHGPLVPSQCKWPRGPVAQRAMEVTITPCLELPLQLPTYTSVVSRPHSFSLRADYLLATS